MTKRAGRPASRQPSRSTWDEEVQINIPKSLQDLMKAFSLTYCDKSVLGFKAWLLCVLEQVPEYTYTKKSGPLRAPMHNEVKPLLDSDDEAVIACIETPLEGLTTEDVAGLTHAQKYARLVRHLTTKLERRREQGQNDLLDHTPTFSTQYRDHSNPDLAKFKLVWNLVCYVNKQFHAKGIFRNEGMQKQVNTIYDNYTRRPGVNVNVDQVEDAVPSSKIQFHLVACPDLGIQYVHYSDADFPVSLQAFKDIVFARFSLSRERIALNAIYGRPAGMSSQQFEIKTEDEWKDMFIQELPTYHLPVVHEYSPPFGQPGNSTEPGFIPSEVDRFGSFPAVLGKARSIGREAQLALIDKAKELLARRKGEVADFVIEGESGHQEGPLRSAREYRRQEISTDLQDKAADAQAVSREDIELYRSALSSERQVATEQEAIAYLKDATGLADLSPILRLPERRMRQQGSSVEGFLLKPHQTTGLATLIDKEATVRGSVLADTMGLGKTELFCALMVAGNAAEDHRVGVCQDPPARGINAVVVPSQLAAYMTGKLHDIMGVGWRVYRLGEHKQLYESSIHPRRIKIGRKEVPWSDADPNAPPQCQRILVMTYEDLSSMTNKSTKKSLLSDELLVCDQWHCLLRRIIFDEGHSMRHFEATVRGQNARLFSPRYRHVVTGTPILCTARDLRGYVALLERPDWLNPNIDRNEERLPDGELDENGRYNRYRAEITRCKLQDALPDENLFQNEDEAWHPNVRATTEGCIDDGTARGRLLNTGVVTQFPATLFYNSHHRRHSLPRKERHLRTWQLYNINKFKPAEIDAAKQRHKEEMQEHYPLPFEGECPFDTYSPYDKNKVRCLTVQAFNAWIEPHLVRWEKHQDHKSLSIASDRLRIIYEILFVAHNAQTTVKTADGGEAVIGSELPPLRLTRCQIRLTEQEQDWYREYERAISQEIEDGLRLGQDNEVDVGVTMTKSNPDEAPNPAVDSGEASAQVQPERVPHYRSTIIPMISHLGVFALRMRTTPEWQEQKNRTLAALVWELRKCKALDLHEEDDPFSNEIAVLEQALRGAAPLTKALVDIWDTIENAPPESNNSIAYCYSPRTVEVLNKILQWVGISTVVLRSDDTPDERNRLVTEQFNKSSTSYHVLLAPLTLQIAGWNLHPRCHHVIFVEEPPGLPIFEQAMFRVRRLGQRFEQNVKRYYVPGTYHVEIERTMLQRAVQIEMIINDHLHTRNEGNTRSLDGEDRVKQAEQYCLNVLGLIDERDS